MSNKEFFRQTLFDDMAFYSDSVEIVHADEKNYGKLKGRKTLNYVMSSKVRLFDASIIPVGLSLKYVADGQESYWVSGKHLPIKRGQYLLVNDSVPAVDVQVKNDLTSGVCIDIDPKLVNDVLDQILQPDDLESYVNVQKYLLSPEILIRRSKSGPHLQSLLNHFLYRKETLCDESRAVEFIYEVTGTLIRENLDLIEAFFKIRSAKSSTRKELFSRLLMGKDMIDDHIYTKISISEIAQECSVSEFRFFRLFRQCFGMSPYDYYLTAKMKKSVELHNEGLTWGEIGHMLNFNDASAFNKAFKKVHNIAPSLFGKNL